jgi:hypothetical protein
MKRSHANKSNSMMVKIYNMKAAILSAVLILWTLSPRVFAQCSPDVTPPVISNCPANITVNALNGQCQAKVTAFNAPTASQALDQSNPGIQTGFSGSIWQSFTAGQTGKLVTVGYNKNGCGGNSGILNIYSGTGTGGTLLYSAPYSIGGCSGMMYIGIPYFLAPTLTAGQTYTMYFSNIWAVMGYTYTGGSSSYSVYDLNFETYVQAIPAGISATDNCSATTLTSNYQIGDNFPVGTTTVTYTAKDASNNTSTCSFNVTVVDNQDPIITCPANITQNAPLGSCSATVTVPTPAVSDNCGVASVTNNFTGTSNASGVYPKGTTQVVWTVTDIHGRTSSCTQTIIVTQTVSLTCSANITVSATPGTCGAFITVPQPATSGLCSGLQLSNSFNGTSDASGTYPIGVTNVVWTFKDVTTGASVNCTQVITITETHTLSITCPANITQTADAGVCGANVTVPVPTYSAGAGNSSCLILTNNFNGTSNASGFYPKGTTTVVWTLKHGSGDQITCSQTVTVTDNEKPTFNCTDIVINTATQDACSAVFNVRSGSQVLDQSNPGIQTGFSGSIWQSFTPAYNGRLMYVGYDKNGCGTNAGTLNIYQGEGTGGTLLYSTPYNIGGCSGMMYIPIPFEAAVQLTAGQKYTMYFSNIWAVMGYTYTGGISSYSVYDLNFETHMWALPTSVNASPAAHFAMIAAGGMADDNCNVATFTSNHQLGETFPVGSTPVTWTAVDDAGNTKVCNFNIIVRNTNTLSSALTAAVCNNISFSYTPTSIVPGTTFSWTRAAVAGISNAAASGTGAINETLVNTTGAAINVVYMYTCAANGCTGQPVAVTVSVKPTPTVTITPSGATTFCPSGSVVLTASGASTYLWSTGATTAAITVSAGGNYSVTGTTAGCTSNTPIQTVTVVDNQPPVVTCPANITKNVTAGTCATTATFAATGTDNCTAAGALTFTYSQASGSSFPVGVTTVTVTAKDASNNVSAPCSFTITVVDNQLPVVVTQNKTVYLDANGNANITAADINNGSTDNCGVSTVSVNPATFNCSPVADNLYGLDFDGTNDVVNIPYSNAQMGIQGTSFTATAWIKRDDFSTVDRAVISNNGCQLHLIIRNNRPYLGFCGNDIGGNTVINSGTWYHLAYVYNATGGVQSIYVNGVLDVSGGGHAALTADNPFRIGAFNNTGSGAFDGRIDEVTLWNSALTASQINTIMNSSPAPNASGLIGYWNMEDASGTTLLDRSSAGHNGTLTNMNTATAWSTDHAPGSSSIRTATLTVTDVNGNSNTGTALVTVLDTIKPAIVGPANITVNAATGQCAANVSFAAIATDNCTASPTITYSQNPGTSFPIGTTTVTATAKDISNNISAPCSFTVTVNAAPASFNLTAVTGDASILNNGLLVDARNLGVSPANIQVNGVCFSNIPATTTNMSIGSGNFCATCTGNMASLFSGQIFQPNGSPSTVTINGLTPCHNYRLQLLVANMQNTTGDVMQIQVEGETYAFSNWRPGPKDLVIEFTATATSTVVNFLANSGAEPERGILSAYALHDLSLPSAACNQPPVANAGADQNIFVGTNCLSTASLNGSSSTDPNGNNTIVSYIWSENGSQIASGQAASVTLSLGVHNISLTVTDIWGITSTDALIVTVGDNTAPVVACPANIILNAVAGACAANATFAATGTDNCTASGALIFTYSQNSGTSFPVGTTTVSVTAKDAAGNVSTPCSFTVTIKDVEAPAITCPSNVTVSVPSGSCVANVTVPVASATDNCGSVAPVAPFTSSNSNLMLWLDATRFSLSNGANMSGVLTDASSYNRAMTTNSTFETSGFNGHPTMRYNNNQTALTSPFSTNNNSYVFMAVQILSTPTSWASLLDHHDRDNGLSIEENGVAGANTYHWQTGNDNTNVNQTVTFGTPYIMVATITGGNARSFTLYRNNGGVLQSLGTVTNSSFNVAIGNNHLYIGRSNIGEYSDMRLGEMIYFQNSLPVTESSVVNYLFNKWLNNASPVTVVNNFNNTGNASGTYPVGTTNVTWTATDASGNSSICTQTVTVVDNQNPVIACPVNITHTADAGVCNYTTNISPATATDNCAVSSVTGVRSDALALNAPYPVGTTTITWTATDIHSNTSSCTQTIIVTDNEKPVITCPASITHTADAGVCSYTVNIGTATATDNCSVATIAGVRDDNAQLDASYPVGVTTVTWTATDIHGNTSSCTQTITVTDDENPVITCPASITHTADAGVCSYTVNIGTATATDNCAVATIVGVRDDNAQLDASYPVGTTTVTWTATDIHGNSSTCTQTITVTDDEKPVITCPASVTHTADAGVCSYTVNIGTATATDNCAVATIVGVRDDNAQLDASYPVGTTTVTWTATDIHGNSSTCTQTIIVTDDEKPVITCPASITHTADAGVCSYTVNIGTATATDNCAVATIVGVRDDNAQLDAAYPVGTTTVTWTTTDIHGNTSSCIQTITVTDDEKPVITCPANITHTADAGVCSYTVNIGTATATDNCAVATIVGVRSDNAALNAPYPVGTTTVTWTATDIHGNVGVTCTQTIIVTDDEKPVITCPASITHTADAGVCSYTVNIGTAAATDNCAVATITGVRNDAMALNAVYPVGTTTVTWTATDIHGNSSTCTQTIIVTDNEKPNTICKPYTLNLSNGAGSITPADVDNSSTDNCGIATRSVTPNSFTCANAGDNTVTLTITDIHGNTSSCQTTVTVQYQPTCTIAVTPANTTYTGGVVTNLYLGYGPQSATLTANPVGGTGFTYSWAGNTSKLSCTNCQNPVFTPTAGGTYTYTVTATNSNGCSTSCQVTFCVKDIRDGISSNPNNQKVFLCHLPPGNPGNPQLLSISVNAVPSHLGLHSGDRLGKCDQTCGGNKGSEMEQQMEAGDLKVYPNPSTGMFIVELPSEVKGGEAMIMDMTGKLIERKMFMPDSKLIFDLGYVAKGIYLIQVKNGTNVYRAKVTIN